MLNETERATFERLRQKLGREVSRLRVLDSYYNGVQELAQLGLAIPPELAKFVTIVAWPSIVVDTLEERCDVEGFRIGGQTDREQDLWRIWQANDLDEEAHLAHIDALVYGRSWVVVGTDEDDEETPITTVESPLEMTGEWDTRRRRLTAALKLGAKNTRTREQSATLYLPDKTIWLQLDSGRWVEENIDEHELGDLPVVLHANRARTAASGRFGISQMERTIALTDAAARALTNLQVAQETHAVPQRWALGVSKGDFVDKDGNPLPVWQSYFSSIWANENKDTQVGQFSASDLRNFQVVVELYAHQLAGVTGLPVRYFGQNTANPPSADGIRADEARLVKQAERHNRARSGGWERWARLVDRIKTGEWNNDLKSLETVWADPATPTRSQTSEAAVKLYTSGILPLEATWEELGYSPERRIELRKMVDADQVDPFVTFGQGIIDTTTAA